MNQSKTLTIQLPPEDWERLETEAKRLDVSPETLALIVLQFSLAKVHPSIDALVALWKLREIGRKLPPVDVVELVRAGREDLEKRGIF